MEPPPFFFKDTGLKHIKTSNVSKWDPEMKLIRLIDGTLLKHLMNLKGTRKGELLRMLDGTQSKQYQNIGLP